MPPVAIRHIDTDLLVIGGGAAGARAAIEAHGRGLDVTLVVKGLLGKSGCSIFAGNLNWFGNPGDGARQTDDERVLRGVTFLTKLTHYIGDQEYFKSASGFDKRGFFPWLEERGLYILRTPDGDIVTDRPLRSEAWATKMGLSGQIIMNLMRKEILARTVRLLEETSATSLLTDGDRAVGATAIDYRNSELVVVRAKAVILATGHSNYLATRSTGTREGAANGWVLGYRIGLELQNLEIQWFHASDVAWPRSWMRLHLYPNPLPGTTHRTQLFNSHGEFFFDGNLHANNPVPYVMQCKALIRQIKQGKARVDGGYYTSYRHVEPEVLDNYVSQTAFIRKVGLDPTKDLIENGITWHMNAGGLRTSGKTMESGLPGLLIAGSVSALATGGIMLVTYDGLIAADRAAEWCVRSPFPRLIQEQVAADHRRVLSYFRTEPADGLSPAQVKKRIRDVMWEHMNLIKTEKTMLEGCDKLDRLRRELLPRMRLQSTSHRYNYEWIEAVDAEDMLDACQLVIRFSLFRKESRGPFYRDDYPYTDNGEWLVHVVGRNRAGDLQLRTEPVDLPYARPAETGRADYFACDY